MAETLEDLRPLATGVRFAKMARQLTTLASLTLASLLSDTFLFEEIVSSKAAIDIPVVAYEPAKPVSYRPDLGVIGCGGIIKYHLQAYLDAGYSVAALCDPMRERAEKAAAEFFPDAKVYTDYRDLLRLETIEVVDIATHPPERPAIIRAALEAGKHVLSQKPFVLDLDVGLELAELAEKRGRLLAVNQNGRWAPHFSFARNAVASGMIGETFGAHLSVHWDHTWVKGTPFENVKHLILYDYAIHWFDMLRCLLPSSKAKRVFASTARTSGQKIMPNMLGQALIEWDNAQSTLAFDAALPVGPKEETFVSGTQGSIHSIGTGNQEQTLTVNLATGRWQPILKGKWFPDGFRGTMGELLCAIEERRTPSISARDNLESLALCFAAVESSVTNQPVVPWATRRLPD